MWSTSCARGPALWHAGLDPLRRADGGLASHVLLAAEMHSVTFNSAQPMCGWLQHSQYASSDCRSRPCCGTPQRSSIQRAAARWIALLLLSSGCPFFCCSQQSTLHRRRMLWRCLALPSISLPAHPPPSRRRGHLSFPICSGSGACTSAYRAAAPVIYCSMSIPSSIARFLARACPRLLALQYAHIQASSDSESSLSSSSERDEFGPLQVLGRALSRPVLSRLAPVVRRM